MAGAGREAGIATGIDTGAGTGTGIGGAPPPTKISICNCYIYQVESTLKPLWVCQTPEHAVLFPVFPPQEPNKKYKKR